MQENFLWLENIEATQSLEWVESQNQVSLERLQGDERYETFRERTVKYLTDDERLPVGQLVMGKIRNFWQDENHIKGILRETTLDRYTTESPDWTTVLDIDALAAEENEDWVYKGRTCLGPQENRCLVHLSRGGSDAVEIREFDFTDQNFVTNGFFLPEAKTQVEWLDEDHLLVGTDFGPGSLTSSGYARILKKWRRGTTLAEAELVFEASENDMLVSADAIYRPDSNYIFVVRRPSFFEEEVHFYQEGTLTQIPLPVDIDYRGMLGEYFLFELRKDWTTNENDFNAGDLISIHLEKSLAAGKPVDTARVYASRERIAINSSVLGRDAVYLFAMDDVDGKLLELRPSVDGWTQKDVDLPERGSLELITNDPNEDLLLVKYESFTVPASLYLLNQGAEPELIKEEPARFDAAGMVTNQYFAESQDGTRVPYYVISSADMPLDGSNPTVVYAYGGFEVSLTPTYMGAIASQWVEAGGAWVQANLRGGGEYGPDWHNAALLENRQLAYDDYIAVAEDLIARKITSPDKLGIRGGSNGGLLVTAVMVQRPDLYRAVICAVPLIDMLRYHKLSAGASWMAEYGDPDVPEQAAYISRYSPFQNVIEEADYPEVFFWTNMKDDRVHPSHARRMVAKMLSQGHDVLYFENTEGGHGGGADPIALAHTSALELTYLMQRLMD